MDKYFRYLWYILKHKWYVFVECVRLNVPFLGIVHDLSKFSPSEFVRAARRYCGEPVVLYLDEVKHIKKGDKFPCIGRYAPSLKVVEIDAEESTVECMPTSVINEYKQAWLHHQRHNKHHWTYWVVYTPIPDQDYDEAWGCHPLPDRYRREMLADWRGSSKTFGGPGVAEWYEKNKGRMLLHPDTRAWVEEQLGCAEH